MWWGRLIFFAKSGQVRFASTGHRDLFSGGASHVHQQSHSSRLQQLQWRQREEGAAFVDGAEATPEVEVDSVADREEEVEAGSEAQTEVDLLRRERETRWTMREYGYDARKNAIGG